MKMVSPKDEVDLEHHKERAKRKKSTGNRVYAPVLNPAEVAEFQEVVETLDHMGWVLRHWATTGTKNGTTGHPVFYYEPSPGRTTT